MIKLSQLLNALRFKSQDQEKYRDTSTISRFRSRCVRNVIRLVLQAAGAKEHTTARNSAKSIVRRNVEKAVALAQIRVIAVIYSALAVALAQRKKNAWHVETSTMTACVNMNVHR